MKCKELTRWIEALLAASESIYRMLRTGALAMAAARFQFIIEFSTDSKQL